MVEFDSPWKESLDHYFEPFMELPSPLALQFETDLLQIEQEKQMPYVTSIERLGMERGIERGIEQGVERGVWIGQIQMAERMLGREETAKDLLIGKSSEELRTQSELLLAEVDRRFHRS